MSTTEIKVNDRVRLTKDIYDDGAEHHPPGYIAFSSEIVVVRKLSAVRNMNGSLCVSHENITDRSFVVYADEYERLTG